MAITKKSAVAPKKAEPAKKPAAKPAVKAAAPKAAAPKAAPAKVVAPVKAVAPAPAKKVEAKAPAKVEAKAPAKVEVKAPAQVVSKPELKEEVFTVFSPDSKSVEVAGNFNGWDPSKGKMKRDKEGNWTLKLKLAKGSYQYKIVFDGNLWECDQKAPSVMAEHGPNSVRNVD